MSTLSHKIDFAVIIKVKNANPNGDPLNGNRPRTDYEGLGEITDVCLKRKIRDRLMEAGQCIFVQSDDRKNDPMRSLQERAESDTYGIGKNAFKNKEEAVKKACAQWLDVRAFGQLFAFKGGKKKEAEGDAGGVSIAIRGPVSVQSAFSVEPVSISSVQITKSVSGGDDGKARGSDTMGMKYRVDSGIYVCYGSMNPQLAERTGFSDEDAAAIKAVLPRLFENDASSARPEGTMSVLKVLWWQHSCKSGQYSSARVHGSIRVESDGTYSHDATATPGLVFEEIEGF